MTKKPLISVIITYFDKLEYIKKTLESVLAQSYKNYELIFIYDDNNLNDFTFYDIGCGKGKVLIVWKEFLLKNNLNNNIYGLDYSSELIEIAKQNYFKIFNQHGNFVDSDVSNVHFKRDKYYLFYLYNPFNEKILSIFFKKIKFCKFLLIYNVPLHHDLVLKQKKIKIVYQKIGKHLNENFNIYKNY